ncbi:YcjX family GTP-binding protein [Kangiella geojedonensis]|uniref:ATPase n=1 Tax=Kangiella geojedonensis TaxID=914150 RepID=A0A0F6RBI3_9GAMM|nr:YcjX family protein [Kangiella geojedonensis]AKE51583.1 hypothetical protein TQ33_0603 [Kangiella geojedonensis]
MDLINKFKSKSSELINRGLNRNVRIAVTGLSGAGKTAFTTSLINQLLHAPMEKHLTFLSVNVQNRMLASKLSQHEELHIPAFDYNNALAHLTSDIPQWPDSTRNISQAQIKCRFKVGHRWAKRLQSDSTVTVEVVDYPGEWLLDLPLLAMDYRDWSKACIKYLNSARRQQYSEDIQSKIKSFDYKAVQDDVALSKELKEIANVYRSSLMTYRNEYNDYGLALPGRFILPGSLKEAPTLDFFPVLNEDVLSLNWDQFEQQSTLKVLEKRFNYYKENVIKPFFEEYFTKVDRQIVLIDTCSVLESGYETYQDLKDTVEKLLEGFSYGRSNWLKRLFSPSIDKLMIAATKVDLVPPDQHSAMESFMQKMVAQAKNNVGYEGVEVETMAISAVATSEPVATEHEGVKLLCVKGIEEKTGESVIHYPGRVPDKGLSRQEWKELKLDFTPFAIPELSKDEALPHIRMDKVIEFLIGDKFI